VKLSKSIKKEIVEKLLPLNPEKIILFGSYAYGVPIEDSDLDICIVEKDNENKFEEKRKIRNLLKDINMSKDIILEKINFYNFHSTDDWINTALYDINHYGEVLFEKKWNKK